MAKKKSDPVIETQEEEFTPAEVIGTSDGLVQLNKFDELVIKYESYKDLTIKDASDKEGYKKVEKARKEVKSTKVEVDKVRKSIIQAPQNFINQVNAKGKAYYNSFLEIEKHLDAESSRIDEEIEGERRRKLEEFEEMRAKRLDQILTIGAKFNNVSAYKIGDISINMKEIETMDDEQFINVTSLMEQEAEVIRQQEAIRLAQEEAHRKRQEEEAQKLKAEAEAQIAAAAEERKKLEEERKELQKQAEKAAQEQAELKRQRDEAELKAKVTSRTAQISPFKFDEDKDLGILSYKGHALMKSSDIKDLSDDEWNEFITALPAALEDTDAQIEKEQEQARLREQQLIKDTEERVARESKEKADKEKADREREEALKPDKEKLLSYSEGLVIKPDLNTEEANAILSWYTGELEKLQVQLRQKIQSLK